MLKLGSDTAITEGEESVEGFRRVRIGYAFHELVNGANGVRAHVLGSIVEHKPQYHVVERFRQMHAYLAESAGHGIHQLHCGQVSKRVLTLSYCY